MRKIQHALSRAIYEWAPDDHGPVLVTERDGRQVDPAMGRDDLTRQFKVLSLDGLGLGGGAAEAPAVGAAGALLRYLREL